MEDSDYKAPHFDLESGGEDERREEERRSIR